MLGIPMAYGIMVTPTRSIIPAGPTARMDCHRSYVEAKPHQNEIGADIVDQTTGNSTGLTSWPQGIAAITLFVEDLEAAKQFYLTVFGLPVTWEDDNWAVFTLGTPLSTC